MSSHPATPRVLPLDASPDEVALRLRHCPGLVWLDSSGHRPQSDPSGGLSFLAASPRALLRGHLRDLAPLHHALAQLRASQPSAPDWGFPLSGLFGSIDYDGHYHFGLYDELLIYRHATGEWLATGPRLPLALAPPSPAPPPPPPLHFAPDQSSAQYQDLVLRAQAYIAAGDIYQVNLAHRFTAPWPAATDPLALALQLRAASPAPYAAYLHLGGRHILSSSPESFLKISGQHIRTRPIKGTRPRFLDPAADERSAIELIRSEKERAELLMITDLMRHDLGQCCAFGSVRVTDLLRLETYQHVFHLVSTIEGTLRPDVSHLDALRACFPGGSITGAPKRRAQQIIAELEPSPRGLYTGAIGYLSPHGESQFSIAIRTLTLEKNLASFHVGAGIVADSIPALEWQETLHKAVGILTACQPPHAFRAPLPTP